MLLDRSRKVTGVPIGYPQGAPDLRLGQRLPLKGPNDTRFGLVQRVPDRGIRAEPGSLVLRGPWALPLPLTLWPERRQDPLLEELQGNLRLRLGLPRLRLGLARLRLG